MIIKGHRTKIFEENGTEKASADLEIYECPLYEFRNCDKGS